jgi:uncharacterized RDD family membrane protein YckC
VAILIDGAILSFAYLIIFAAIAAAVGSRSSTASNHSNSPVGAVVLGTILIWIIVSLPAATYYGALNGSRRGQTVGKMALSIAVRDGRTGAPIGFWCGFGRYLITTLFVIAFLVPYVIDSLAPLWDGRCQAWHDKVAHSVVLDLKP